MFQNFASVGELGDLSLHLRVRVGGGSFDELEVAGEGVAGQGARFFYKAYQQIKLVEFVQKLVTLVTD